MPRRYNETGTTFVWTMTGVNPPFNKNLSKGARPKWLVEWQAIPILEEIGADVLDHPDRRIQDSKAGLQNAVGSAGTYDRCRRGPQVCRRELEGDGCRDDWRAALVLPSR